MEEFLRFHREQSVVGIQQEALERCARHLSESEDFFEQLKTRERFPLQFSSEHEEINLLALKELFMVGSMFEHMTQLAHQESLNDVVLFGLIGAFLSESKLNATFMRGLSASDISSLFSVPMTQRVDDLESKELSSVVTMEIRGGMADYADLLANVSYSAGAALIENGFDDLSSLLEKENLDSSETSLETSCRSISSRIQSLDDRHFIASKCSRKDEMIELPFLKNARRMVMAVLLRKLGDSEEQDGIISERLREMIPAPSVCTVNTLFQMGILSYTCSDIGEEAKIEKELAVRNAAVVACYELCASIEKIRLDRAKSAKHEITPIQLSKFLDAVPSGIDTINGVSKFIPIETGKKW